MWELRVPHSPPADIQKEYSTSVLQPKNPNSVNNQDKLGKVGFSPRTARQEFSLGAP